MKRFLVLILLAMIVAYAISAETIKIGFFAPLTGFAAADGTSALHGAQLAIKLINSKGGVNGKELELVYYDDALKADQAVSIAYKLVQKDKVVVAISGSYSGTTRAAAGIFQQLKVPMISAYAVHPQITATGDYIFRVGTLATVQGRAGAHLAVEKIGAKKIAVLVMDNDFGVSLAKAFVEEAKKLGAEIVYEEKYPLGEKDFRALLLAIKKLDPDAIYATAYYSEAAHIVSQAKELGIYVPIIGQEGYDSPKFIELAKNHAANGTVITTDLDRDSEDETVQWFIKTYKETYGIDADMVAASAFDAVVIAAKAIELGGETPEGVKKGLSMIKEIEGTVTGFKGFTEKREAMREITCQVVIGNRFHYFWKITDPEITTP